MNAVTHEWIEKAEGDYEAAGLLLRARKHPNYDAVCFHAQQCAEKYLKARLHASGTRFPRIHDISALLDLVLPLEPEWELFRRGAELLTDYAVRFRYPGAAATKPQAREAVKACEIIRERVRLALRLKMPPTANRARTKRTSTARRPKGDKK